MARALRLGCVVAVASAPLFAQPMTVRVAASTAARPAWTTGPVQARVGETVTLRDAGADHGGAGSSWWAAEVAWPDGRTLRTPDGASVDRFGLSPAVLRVSFREGDAGDAVALAGGAHPSVTGDGEGQLAGKAVQPVIQLDAAPGGTAPR